MSLADARGLTPSDAIKKAKSYFDEFFENSITENVLLEELDFDESEHVWHVTLGFDVGRTLVRKPNQNALAMFGQQEITPIRESRTFFIVDETGELLKMT